MQYYCSHVNILLPYGSITNYLCQRVIKNNNYSFFFTNNNLFSFLAINTVKGRVFFISPHSTTREKCIWDSFDTKVLGTSINGNLQTSHLAEEQFFFHLLYQKIKISYHNLNLDFEFSRRKVK